MLVLSFHQRKESRAMLTRAFYFMRGVIPSPSRSPMQTWEFPYHDFLPALHRAHNDTSPRVEVFRLNLV